MPSAYERQTLRRVVADIVRRVRHALGWTQQRLAEEAGVSRGLVASVETARISASLDTVAGLLTALGVRYELVARAPFLPDGMRQRDRAHALCSAYVHRRLESSGWLVRREVEIVHGRSHGWIDLLAFHPLDRRLVVNEVKTELDDLGVIERTIGWYERSAWRAARELGWRPASVSAVLLALATEANDARLTQNSALVDRAFPMGGDDLLAGATRMAQSGADDHRRGVALVDPRSRRRKWLIRPRVRGRRSKLAYLDYATFVRSFDRR